MIDISVEKILEVTRGTLLKGSVDFKFNNIFYDVIKEDNPAGEFLYVPYINSYRKIDSTSLIAEMPQAGAKGVILNKNMDKSIDTTGYEVVIEVEDLEIAVLSLAKHLRYKNGNNIVAVTGSSGKTTSKELISEILKFDDRAYKKTLRNINGYGGASHTIFSLKQGEIGVLEVGVNGLQRIPLLAEAISPNFLLVTNIYHTHFDKMPDLEDVAKNKLSLANHLRDPQVKVLYGDSDYLEPYIDNNTVTFGWNSENHYHITETCYCNEKGSKFIISANGKRYDIITPLLGKHNIVNALGVFALCSEMGIRTDSIIQGIASFSGIKDDFYSTLSVQNVKGWSFLDDSQHFNLPALKIGLDTFSKITNGRGGVVLLSYDYKFNSPNFNHDELFNILLENKDLTQNLILVGEGWEKFKNWIIDNLSIETVFIPTKGKAAKYIADHVDKGTFIYLKGDFNDHLRGILVMLGEGVYDA